MLRRAHWGGIAATLGLALLSGAGRALAQAEGRVIFNAVEASQVPGQAVFDVTAFVTVVDAAGQPITGLAADDFSLTEDSVPVELFDVSSAAPGADLVLVLDTSGSMNYQGKMAAVQGAAASFVENLAAEDRVAIVVFNQQIDILQNFSQDHVAAASIVGLISAEPGAGTCLYDAAYQAVELATAAPQGRRAVILLTDGVDELPNAPGVACSSHTLAEVVELASGGTTRSPIYTIGVGSDVNEQELRQLADDTGGTAVVAPTAGEVASLFETLGQQLKSQYALTYQSSATSGEQHSLAVAVMLDGSTSVDQRAFVLPEPVVLTVVGLAEGEVLEGVVTVQATVSGEAEVERVVFSVDGETLSEAGSPPFETALDNAGLELEAGTHILTVEAELAGGQTLSRSVRFAVEVPFAAGLPEGEAAAPEAVPPPALVAFVQQKPVLLATGGVALVMLVAVLALLVARRRPAVRVVGGASGYAGAEDLTRDIVIADVLAILTVRESLSLMPGQPFDISEPVVSLGRAADNQIVIPDAPISRQHAEIRLEDGAFRVYDLGSTYGTFVNGEQVGPDGLPLQDGDELGLGTRTRLAFNVTRPTSDEDEYPTVGMAGGAAQTVDEAARPLDETVQGEDDAGLTLPIDEGAEAGDETRPHSPSLDDPDLTVPLDGGE